jgi:hypothetical protein
MSNVVFILGAGCSKECGAPLMSDFLDIAYHLYGIGKVNDNKTHFENVFKAIGTLQVVHSKSQLDLNNIESIFNAFETANTLGKLPSYKPEEIPGVIESLKKVIVSTLERTVEFPTRKSYIGVPQPYDRFAELLHYIVFDAIPKRTVSIITFNYDIAVDMALYKARLGLDYGFDTNNTNTLVPLLKLHGSLNWASKVDDNSIVPLTLDNYFRAYNFMGLEDSGICFIPIGSQLQEYFSKYTKIEVKPEPVIVPPSWNKVEHHQTVINVWSRAAKELGEAEYVFIIGYSLPETDAFFRLLYALGTVGDTPFKRIEVFNPDATGEVRKRFESLMGPGASARFYYNALSFGNAIGTIRGYFPNR